MYNIKPDGRIGKTKYPYNSGQMMQSAALLYKFTADKSYLKDAQDIAKSCCDYFFVNEDVGFKMLKRHDTWFIAVMLRGFIELYHQDKEKIYLDAFRQNLDYAWNHLRDNKGLFNNGWREEAGNRKK